MLFHSDGMLSYFNSLDMIVYYMKNVKDQKPVDSAMICRNSVIITLYLFAILV